MLPEALTNLITELSRIPSVGERTAERYALHLLRRDAGVSQHIARALQNLHSGVKTCPVTFALIDPDQDVSPLYDNPARDKAVVCVVEQPLDILPIEQSGAFKGTYHVLGGALSPIDDITPDKLKINELIDRVANDDVDEVIIATNTTTEGESTAYYLEKIISEQCESDVTVTRIARGLPAGLDLEFADHYTIAKAIEHRTDV